MWLDLGVWHMDGVLLSQDLGPHLVMSRPIGCFSPLACMVRNSLAPTQAQFVYEWSCPGSWLLVHPKLSIYAEVHYVMTVKQVEYA